MPATTVPVRRRRPVALALGAVAISLVAVLAACDVPVKPAAKLFDAWKAGTTSSASAYATSTARAQIASQAYSASAGWTFVVCDGTAGAVYCTWINKAEGQLRMKVDSASQKVVEVTRISLGNVPAGRTFHAWRVGQPDLATSYATASARTALFSRTYSAADHWLPEGCEGAAGSTYCTWVDSSAKTLVLRVDDVETHKVVAVSGTA